MKDPAEAQHKRGRVRRKIPGGAFDRQGCPVLSSCGNCLLKIAMDDRELLDEFVKARSQGAFRKPTAASGAVNLSF
jgi:hypothetical protein